MKKNFFGFDFCSADMQFMYYLLWFATSEGRSQDSILADCAEELFGYILGAPEKRCEKVEYIFEDEIFIVNETECVYITDYDPRVLPRRTWDVEAAAEATQKAVHAVVYDLHFEKPREIEGEFWLTSKKVRDTLRKYPLQDRIVSEYLDFLNDFITEEEPS